MSRVTDLLNELATLNPSLLTATRPGLSRSKILAAFDDLPIKPTEELISLFSWRNGSKEDVAAWIVPGHYLLPLDDAIYHFRIALQISSEGLRSAHPLDCLPYTFDMGGGSFVAKCGYVVVDSDLIVFSSGEDLPRTSANNLASELSVVVECFRRGIFYCGEDWVEVKDPQAWQIVADELGRPGPYSRAIYPI